MRIRSASIHDPPRIAPNYLSTDEDRRVAAESLRVTRRIVAQPALARYSPVEHLPGAQFTSDEELVREGGAYREHHFSPGGTARMGAADDPEPSWTATCGCAAWRACGSSTPA